ncbi:MAG: amidophosphoribosyltransferase, partial [Mesorhizobium sp.]
VEADIVVPVPDSGTPAAIGFSQAAGIPFELGIIRNHYVGRTFIQPGDSIRHMGVKLKHNANRRMIEGKRVVLVDDSIVRGTTSCFTGQYPTRLADFEGSDNVRTLSLLAAGGA